MMDLERMRERFIRDDGPVRMGNLASNLLRLSKWVQKGHNDEEIVALMRQISWSMEWMGNLASNLLRLSKWVQKGHNDEAIVDLMRQIAWLMEWTGSLASAELADMQREICRWRRVWPLDQARHILSLRASQMSSRILEQSGLLEQNTR